VYTSLRFGILCAVIGAAMGSATGLVAGRAFGAWVRRSVAPLVFSQEAPPVASPPDTDAPANGAVPPPPGGGPLQLSTPAAASEAAFSSAAADAAPATASPSDCAGSDATPAPEAFRAFDRARAAIDHGVARGIWSTGDRDGIHKDLMMLPLETRNDIERPLVSAVRDGRVRFRGRGPLF
jgi:hypothetical protein